MPIYLNEYFSEDQQRDLAELWKLSESHLFQILVTREYFMPYKERIETIIRDSGDDPAQVIMPDNPAFLETSGSRRQEVPQKVEPIYRFADLFIEHPEDKTLFAKMIGISARYFRMLLSGESSWSENLINKSKELLKQAGYNPNEYSFDPNFKPCSAGSGGEPVGQTDDKPYPMYFIERNNWSIRKLSDATGIPHGTIQRVIKGRPCPEFMHPDTRVIQKIAEAMGVKPGEIPWVDLGQRAVASMLDDALARGPIEDMDAVMKKIKEQFPPDFIREQARKMKRDNPPPQSTQAFPPAPPN